MTIDVHGHAARPRSRRGETIEFRLLFLLAYPVCLVLAVVDAVLPTSLRLFKGAQGSVLENARAAANTTIPFAFMG